MKTNLKTNIVTKSTVAFLDIILNGVLFDLYRYCATNCIL